MAILGASECNVDTAGGIILELAGANHVRLDGDPWAVVGSPVDPHPPCPFPAIHCAAVMTAALPSIVRINGIMARREKDLADCGHTATGRPWIRAD